MNKKLSSLFFLLSLLILTSCGTSTRFGDWLIPAHKNSNSGSENEVVQLTLGPLEKKNTTMKVIEDPSNQLSGFIPGLPEFLINMAGKKIVSEINKEKKKYKQQYSARERYFFEDGVRKIFLRRKIGGDEKVVAEITAELGIYDAGSYSVGYLDIKSIMIEKSKAKVVKYNYKNPLNWVGNILLKSGDIVRVEINAILKGVSKNGQVTVLNSNYFENGYAYSLANPRKKNINDKYGEWFAAGRVELNGSDRTPLVVELTVTEYDPSNIQKYLTRAADSVEAKQKSLLGN